MVDRYGRCVEVMVLDRGQGPQQRIRVSWRGILLGPAPRTRASPGLLPHGPFRIEACGR